MARQATIMRRFGQEHPPERLPSYHPPEIQLVCPTAGDVAKKTGMTKGAMSDGGYSNSISLAVPGAENDPLLVVEYCTTWLPYDLARLPELDLGDGLSRAMHCYAHGGFMGAAISMLADPEWEHILLDTVHETVTLASKKQV